MNTRFFSRLLLGAATTLALSAAGWTQGPPQAPPSQPIAPKVYVTVKDASNNNVAGYCSGQNEAFNVIPYHTYTITLTFDQSGTAPSCGFDSPSIGVLIQNSPVEIPVGSGNWFGAGNHFACAAKVSTGVFSFQYTIPSDQCATAPIRWSCTCSQNPSDYTGPIQDGIYDHGAADPDPAICSGTGQVHLNTVMGDGTTNRDCGMACIGCNPQCEAFTICATKFYDNNADGHLDLGEQGIDGWKIHVTGPGGYDQYGTTANGGLACFTVTVPGDYVVSEVFPNETNWRPTTLSSVTITVAQPNCSYEASFGNVCLGAGGGLTLGYWGNKNGLNSMNTSCLGMPALIAGLVAENLRNGLGNAFDPIDYPTFKSWLGSATATNMAYMLSAQMATMWLNVNVRQNGSLGSCSAIYDSAGNKVGGVDSGAIIYAPGTTSANAFGFATVGQILIEANTELGLHGLTASGSPYRSYQEALKNALDKANNNLNFVQGSPCGFTYP